MRMIHTGRSNGRVGAFILLVACLTLAVVDIHAQTLNIGPPRLLRNDITVEPPYDGGNDKNVQVTTDGAGVWIGVWQSNSVLDGTLDIDDDIFYTRSLDDGVTWSDLAPLNTNAAFDGGWDQSPQITTDGAGNWVVVWESRDSLGWTIGNDLDILFARSTDAGATWSAPAPLNTNAASDLGHDYSPQVTTDGAENWVAVWASRDSLGGTIGTDSDIFFARSTDAGATWSAPAPLNTNAASDSGYDWGPQLTTDGAGNWVAVWESEDSLGGTIGTDADIFFARSTNAGAIWSTPAPLNSNAAGDSGNDEKPQLTTDDVGNWVVVWYSWDNLGGTIDTDYDIFFGRSTDTGVTWSDPAPLNTNAAIDSGDDYSPQLTTDGAGNWVAVWHSGDSHGGTLGWDSDILFGRSTDAGATWSDPAPLNTNAAFDGGWDFNPQVSTDGAGNWVAVWSSSDTLGGTIGWDLDILFARSTGAGTIWSAPEPLNTNASSDSGQDMVPQLATDGAGNWVAVWESYDSLSGTIGEDLDILFARSADDGATWSAPAALNTNAAIDTGHDMRPQIITDGAGNWVVVWESHDSFAGTIGVDLDILFARSTDAGATWSASAPLNTNAASDSQDDSRPQITTDGAGNWVAVWKSVVSYGGTIGWEEEILFARSTDAGITWSAPAPLYPVSYSGYDWNPQLTTDNMGNWVAVWESQDSLGGTIGTDWDILFARSTDTGATWSAPAPLNANAESDSGNDYHPQVTTDSMGNWVAVWESSDNLGGTIGTDWDILFARSTDAGVTWSAPAPLNTNAASDSGHDREPQLTTDGAGIWIALWYSNDHLDRTIGTDYDILFARSTDAGVTWSAPVALNTNATGEGGYDWFPQLTTDGAGNWVAVWQSDVFGASIIFYTTFFIFPCPSDWAGVSAHSADRNTDGSISLSELLRVVQLFGLGSYHCDASGEDAFNPGPGDTSCVPHSADYNPQDWSISFSELLRVIQLYQSFAYCPCPDIGEDGYCGDL